MNDFTFRPAVRENVALLIALAGGTGSGKTYTAMRLASGIANGARFAVIDTEAGRAKHYADAFKFDHGDLQPPFSPHAYADAIAAADKAGYPVIVVDSFSHEWAGDGGVLDMQERELDRMAGDDWKKREACKMAAWIKPKAEHKRMVQKLLQVRAQLILCFRAEPKVEMIREDGKMKIVPKESLTGKDGWIPICEKNLPFEATCSFLLTADAPGIPKPIKLQEQHRALFPLDRAIAEDSGAAILAWAKGAAPAPGAHPPAAVTITAEQVKAIEKKIADAKIPLARFLAAAKADSLAELRADRFDRAMAWIDRQPSGPAPIEDEAVALRKLDAAQEIGEASAVLDLCKGQTFYNRALEAFQARFPQ